MTLATISRAEPRMAPQPIKKTRTHKPRPAFTQAQRAAALASLAAAEKPETLRRRTRRVEIIPQTGAPQGALAEVFIKREAHGRRLRFRDDHVEVPLANSEQFVRVAILDWHWLHHVKGISRRKWTRGEHGEIRAALDTTRRFANHYYGYDYDVGALLLGLKQGDCYEMDYPCSLMPDTIRQVPRKRKGKEDPDGPGRSVISLSHHDKHEPNTQCGRGGPRRLWRTAQIGPVGLRPRGR